MIASSRIAGDARGSEVLIADVVRQLAAGKGFLFSDHGELVLRGFDGPVRRYEVRWRESATCRSLTPSPAGSYDR